MARHSAQGVVRVSRKPKTASETEIVRLITATNESTPIGNFSQLVKDLAAAGIVISGNQVAIKGDKVTIYNKDEVALFAQDGKLNANLINADTITVNHLYAKSAQGGSVVGHFGNYDKSDAVAGDDKCPLWLGSATAANAPFRVTKDGAMYAVKGTIGGFTIGLSSIGSTSFDPFNSYGKDPRYKMYLTNEYIQHQNNNGYNGTLVSKFVSTIGTECASTIPHRLLNLTAEMEVADSLSAAAYIKVSNYGAKSANSLTTRTGLWLDVSGAGYNYALYAKGGNVLVNGVNAGVKYSRISLVTKNLAYTSSELNVRDNNVWFVECRATGTTLVFPTLKSVRAALNLGDADKFSIRLTIVSSRASTESFSLRGRTADTGYSSSEYPIFFNNNADSDYWGMGKGDVCEVLLTYDGGEYFAQMLVLNR